MKKSLFVVFAVVLMINLAGCGIEETDGTKIKDLEYTVVSEKEIPEELMSTIEEKKAADFKSTYETEEYLYLIHGYGEKETGGYSIAVKELYLTSNAVFFQTELIGPGEVKQASKSPSFPYIVVKTEYQDKNVVFQ